MMSSSNTICWEFRSWYCCRPYIINCRNMGTMVGMRNELGTLEMGLKDLKRSRVCILCCKNRIQCVLF